MTVFIDNSQLREKIRSQLKALGELRSLAEKIKISGENIAKGEASKLTTSGELENRIEGKVLGTAAVIIFGAAYSKIALETGRRPGRMPPPQALEVWAAKKGLGRGVGFAIARNIAKHGTLKHRRQGPKQLTRIATLFRIEGNRIVKNHLRKL